MLLKPHTKPCENADFGDPCAGYFKLASLVQYVPLSTVGGYLGYVSSLSPVPRKRLDLCFCEYFHGAGQCLASHKLELELERYKPDYGYKISTLSTFCLAQFKHYIPGVL